MLHPPLAALRRFPRPRATARVAPTEGYKRCGEVSPSHGFAVPAPFRQGGRGDGGRGCPCCGAQNFCAALRRTLEILTAATRSPRFSCHWQRSARSPQPVTSVTGFAMTGGFTRGAVQRGVGDAAPYGCIIDGAVGRTEASTPTEVYLAVCRGGALPLPRAG